VTGRSWTGRPQAGGPVPGRPGRRRPRGLPLALAVIIVAAAVIAVLKLAGGSAAISCPAAGRPLSSFVPAFFEPPDWAGAVTDGRAPAVMILNPASGPGTAPDPALQHAVRQASAAGSRVIGYIGTNYAHLPSAQVRREVSDYRTWYHVRGIFLDQTPTEGSQQLGYYQDLARYIRQVIGGAVIWINPGAVPDRSYLSVASVVMIFEGSYASYQRLTLPAWVDRYPPGRFAHTIYATPAGAVASAVRLARDRNAGYLFLTPDGGSNPYGALPSYWPGEQAELAGACTAPR
jgi:Spherulation-specific family 4